MSKSQSKNNSPEITVLTCVYNGEDFIKETIDSVLKQTFEDFEYIIVDDKSTDSTVKIIKSYKDKRIRLIQCKQNQGTYKCANLGLENAKGKYVARLDADDVATPSRLQKQYDYMENHSDCTLCGAFGMMIDELGNMLQPMTYPIEYSQTRAEMFFGTSVMHSTAFFRREEVAKLGNYTEDERKTMDFDLYMKILKSGGNIYNMPEFLIFYRKHGASLTLTQFSSQEEIARRVLQKYLKETLDYNVDLDTVILLRRALRDDLDGFTRDDKLKLLRYLRGLYKHYTKTYPAEIDKIHIRYMCFFVVDKFVFNKYLKKLAKAFIVY